MWTTNYIFKIRDMLNEKKTNYFEIKDIKNQTKKKTQKYCKIVAKIKTKISYTSHSGMQMFKIRKPQTKIIDQIELY